MCTDMFSFTVFIHLICLILDNTFTLNNWFAYFTSYFRKQSVL